MDSSTDLWLNNWLTDWLTEWLTDWLIDWLTVWIIGWLIDYMTYFWPTNWLTDWLTDRLTDCLMEWLNKWLLPILSAFWNFLHRTSPYQSSPDSWAPYLLFNRVKHFSWLNSGRIYYLMLSVYNYEVYHAFIFHIWQKFCFRSSTSWLAPKFSNCPSSEHATGAVWLTDVRCRGNESSLDQCPHSGWGVAKGGCDKHTSDACLVCDNPQYHKSGKIYFL